MVNDYILSQLLVLIAYSICGIAFLQKKQIKILFLATCFNILMLIQYCILGGVMGIIANIINITRNLIFIYNLKLNNKNSKFLLGVFLFATILLTIYFYSSPIDIFPCIVALIGTFAYWINSTKVLRICNIICSLCYIIYAIPLHSYITIVAEIYLIITTAIGYIKHEKIKQIVS